LAFRYIPETIELPVVEPFTPALILSGEVFPIKLLPILIVEALPVTLIPIMAAGLFVGEQTDVQAPIWLFEIDTIPVEAQ
jgi:hypothetical protein